MPLSALPARLALAFALACATLVPPAQAAPARTEHVEAQLHAERTAAAPGKPATVGLRLKMKEHWHTYWKSPGDSGLPTKVRWTLPEGWKAGPIQWPHPERLPFGPLVNYGYSGETVLLMDLTPPEGAKPGPVALKADVDWLVCADICVPEKVSLDLAFAVAGGESPVAPAESERFRKARASLPVTLADWKAESTMAGGQLTVRVMPPEGAVAPGKVFFFADRESFIEHAAPQQVVRDGAGFRLTVKLAEPLLKDVTAATGVIVAGNAWPGQPGRLALEVAAPVVAALPAPAAPVPVPDAPADPAGTSLLVALVFAFAGGLLLNLMPCVFPVLGIKVMGFVRHAHGDAKALWMQGAVFTVGVLLSFLVLAGLLLALRAGGAQLGWGFQLQSPAFVTLLAALFLLMALNLFGVFEWGAFAQSVTANLSAKGRYADAFLAGVLATLVATPCTAPFMGAAVGFTLAQPAAVSLAVFAMLGAGMALPVLALSFFPKLLQRLPKPGPWMETFKQVMAFPLLATVVWLAWVLGAQAGNDAILALLLGLLLLALGAWTYGRFARSESLWRLAFAALFAAAGLWIAWPAPGSAGPGAAQASAPRAGELPWQPWSPERLAELRAAGTPVFVDFTAAWCVTCQVNKRVALNREEVVRAFADRGVVPMKADWTNHDPRITAALAELGRNALPVYAVYAPGAAAPKLLPEVLTASIVVEEIARLPAAKTAAAVPSTPR